MIVEISTEDELQEVWTDDYNSVVIDFHGEPWCGPCVKFAPIFEQVSDLLADRTVLFVKVQVDGADREWLGRMGVMRVPTVVHINSAHDVCILKTGSTEQFKAEVEDYLED